MQACCTCPWAQYTLDKPPVKHALLGGLGSCYLPIRALEAVHFRVTMTLLVGSQPWEARFSEKRKGWFTPLTEWQDAKMMVCRLNNHFVFFLGPPIMLIWKLGLFFCTYYFGNFEIEIFNLEENLVKSYMILKLN